MSLLMEAVIREADPSDAEGVIAYLKELSEEPNVGILFWPGEFDPPVEDERRFIQSHKDSDSSILLVVEAGGRIVGVANCTSGERKAVRHNAVIGITLHRDWRDKGLGTQMMHRLIQFARDTGTLTRIELEVFACNARAIHLYEKLGFEHEGVRRRAIQRDGQFHDAVMMAILL